jgi:hypothetical protein
VRILQWRSIASVPTAMQLRRTVTESKARNTSPRLPRTNVDSLSGVWISLCGEGTPGSDDRKENKRTTK